MYACMYVCMYVWCMCIVGRPEDNFRSCFFPFALFWGMVSHVSMVALYTVYFRLAGLAILRSPPLIGVLLDLEMCAMICCVCTSTHWTISLVLLFETVSCVTWANHKICFRFPSARLQEWAIFSNLLSSFLFSFLFPFLFLSYFSLSLSSITV